VWLGLMRAKLAKKPFRLVFLKNGFYEMYDNGKKVIDESTGTDKAPWKVVDGKIHTLNVGMQPPPSLPFTVEYRINNDGSITPIAYIDSKGKREDFPKEAQRPFKKIK
jgi:hypothetical protein